MIKKILACLLLPLGLNAQNAERQVPTKNVPVAVDSLMTAYHAEDLFTGNILVMQNGNTILKRSYGDRDREVKAPNNAGTTFRIGSISKTFTAVVLLQLQERGLLKLEDPIHKFLPDFPKGDSIQLVQLLNNTSGIRDFTDIKGLFPWTRFKDYKELIPFIAKEPHLFAAGEKFSYSSSNFILLCAIAEKVTGKKYTQLLAEGILKPLKLLRTGMDEADREDNNKAKGYEAGFQDLYQSSSDINIAALSGAGGMYSTTGDLATFFTALQTGKLLRAPAREMMFTPHKGNYGLGLEIVQQNNEAVIGHSGAINGFRSSMIAVPAKGTTVILLSNYGDLQTFECYEALKRIIFGLPFEPPQHHRFIQMPASQFAEYLGTYAVNPTISLTVRTEQDRLVADIAGENGLLLYPETRDDFYIRTKNAYLRVVRDEQGKVIAVKVSKGARTSTWQRQ